MTNSRNLVGIILTEETHSVAGHSRSLLSHFGHVTVVNLYRAMAAEWREAHAIL